MSRYYTINGVKQHFGVSTDTVYRWQNKGLMPFIRHKGQRLVAESDVWTFVRPKTRHQNRGIQEHLRKIPREELLQIVEEYITSKVTLQALADRYELTRERMRQLIKEIDPDAPKKHMAYRKAVTAEKENARLAEQLKVRMQEAIDKDRKCVVCGAWVIRKTQGRAADHHNLTCSPEHAAIWPVLRTVDHDHKHRIHQARSTMNNLDTRSESQIAWAKAMLSDNPPKKNRSYINPGSYREQLIKEWRPEMYKMMTHRCGNCRSTCVDHIHMAHSYDCLKCGETIDE